MAFKRSILAEVDSQYGHYTVIEGIYDGRESRVLYGAHNSPQSGLALDDDPELLFNYNQRFLEVIQSISPKKVLLIGGGAFTLPKAILERTRKLILDVVEIDEVLPDIAHQYFFLPDDPRLTIFTQPGRDYIEQTKTKYDTIILDAFSSYSIPKNLISAQAAGTYKSSLTKHGIITINFIAPFGAALSLTDELYTTFKSVFPSVSIFPADPYNGTDFEQNLVLVAGKDKELPFLDYLQGSPIRTPDNEKAVILQDE